MCSSDLYGRHYDPGSEITVECAPGTLNSAIIEALLRWKDPHDPDGTNKPRGNIVAVLEETGMIVEAGRWVIARMLSDRARWLAQGVNAPRVAVNVSIIQLRRGDFTTLLREMIETQHCPVRAGPPSSDRHSSGMVVM